MTCPAREGLEEAKRDMDLLAQLRGQAHRRSAGGCPWHGRSDGGRERYRALLEIGDEIGVVPQIEMWGGNRSIGRVSTAIYIALEAGHQAPVFSVTCITRTRAVRLRRAQDAWPAGAAGIHWNDYPADPRARRSAMATVFIRETAWRRSPTSSRASCRWARRRLFRWSCSTKYWAMIPRGGQGRH